MLKLLLGVDPLYRLGIVLGIGLSLILFQNCGARHETIQGSGQSSTRGGLNMALSLQAYEETFFPIIAQETSCARCHGVSQQPLHALPEASLAHDITISFSLVDLLNPANSRLVQKIRGNHQGFPVAFADEMQAGIEAWAARYLELGGVLGVPEGELGPSFRSIKALILDPKCLSCHNPTGVFPNVNYTDYLSTLNTGGVEPGNASQSDLFTECQSGSMPQGGERLSAEELDALRQWIDQGALNN